MALSLIFVLICCWLFWNALKFYRHMNWNEPAESSPDFKAMRKKEAELVHIQEVLESAHKEGKISDALVHEFNQFYEREAAELKAEESLWKSRHHKSDNT